MKKQKERIKLLGIEIDNLDMKESIYKIEELIKISKYSMVFTPNTQRLIGAQKDKNVKKIYDHADLLIPDGMSIIWASKILGNQLKERVAGSDLFPLFCKAAVKSGYKLFFLGAEPGIADKAKELLTMQNPGIKIVGTYSPPYGFENHLEEINKIIGIIKKRQPDVLFIGLGFPKEEKFVWKYKNEYRAPVSIGIGATFDFIAGKVKRAPKWMQSCGLEWFWRLIQEPRRLWKRYLIGNTVFIWLVFKELIKTKILKKSAKY